MLTSDEFKRILSTYSFITTLVVFFKYTCTCTSLGEELFAKNQHALDQLDLSTYRDIFLFFFELYVRVVRILSQCEAVFANLEINTVAGQPKKKIGKKKTLNICVGQSNGKG